jgi:hypothetical protein
MAFGMAIRIVQDGPRSPEPTMNLEDCLRPDASGPITRPRRSWLLAVTVTTACSGRGGLGAPATDEAALGNITVTQVGGASPSTIVSATLFPARDEARTPAALEIGPCFVQRVVASSDPDAGPPSERLSAGRIVFSGGVDPLTLEPSKSGGYSSREVRSLLWRPDQAISIAADGSALPRFKLTLRMPAEVTLTEPAPGAQIRRDQPLTMRWLVAGTVGKVSIVASQRQRVGADSIDTHLICSAAARDGLVVLPPEALAELPGEGGGTLSMFSSSFQSVRAGRLVARATAAWAMPGTVGVTWR